MSGFITKLAEESIEALPDETQAKVKETLARFTGVYAAIADDMDIGMALDELNEVLVDHPETLRLVHALPAIERALNRFGYTAYA